MWRKAEIDWKRFERFSSVGLLKLGIQHTLLIKKLFSGEETAFVAIPKPTQPAFCVETASSRHLIEDYPIKVSIDCTWAAFSSEYCLQNKNSS